MDKKLKISVQTDLKEGKKLTEFLNQLAAAGNKVAKNLSGVTGGGSTTMKQSALGKAMQEQKALFKDLGKDGQSLSRILKDQVGKSVDELARKYKNVREQLRGAMAEHTKLERDLRSMKGRQSGGETGLGQDIFKMENRLGRSGNRVAAMSAQADIAGREFRAAGGGVGGAISRFGKDMGGAGSMMMGLGRLGFAAWGLNQIRNIPDQVIQDRFSFQRNEAAQQGIFGGMALRAREGDVSDMVALQTLMRDPSKVKDLMGHSDSKGMHRIRSFLGSGGNIKGIFEGQKGVDTEMKQGLAELVQLQKGAMPIEMANMDALRARAGFHVSSMRQMGGLGAMNSLFKTGGKMGFDEGQTAAMFSTIMQQAGRKAAQTLMPKALSAVASGMAEGTAASIMSAGSVAGGDLMGLTGGLAKQAGIVAASGIGGTIAQSIMSGDAVTSGAGFMNTLSQGVTNDAMGMIAMSQNMAGMNKLSSVFGGTSDPFRRSIGFANAIAATGNDASPHLWDALLKGAQNPRMLADMAKGEVPRELLGLGLTPEQAKDFAKRQMRSTLAGFVGSDSAVSETKAFAQVAIDNFGGDPFAAAREVTKGMSTKEKRRFAETQGGLFASLFNTDLGTGTGILGSGIGLGEGFNKKGKFGDLSGGSVARDTVGAQLNKAQEERDTVPGFKKGVGFTDEEAKIKAVLQEMPSLVKDLSLFARQDISPKEVGEGLKNMAQGIEAVSRALKTGGFMTGGAPKTGAKK